jgi:protein-disulfide isomerase
MSRKSWIIIAAAVLLIALGGGAWYYFSDSDEDPVSKPTVAGYEIKPADQTMGNRNAKVVLIEYAAVSCPVCALFNAQVFPQVKKNYIDTGKVFYIFRLFPRMPEDGAGEKMARCVPGHYFPMIDLLFKNQAKWDPEFNVQDSHGGLVTVGQMAGMSAEQVDKCIAVKTDEDRINKVAEEAQSRYGLTGTPTFVINGVAQPSGGFRYDDFAKLLDAALAGH